MSDSEVSKVTHFIFKFSACLSSFLLLWVNVVLSIAGFITPSPSYIFVYLRGYCLLAELSSWTS